jgi:uncharacterized membrane protein HdeD (DUF308 family)
MSSIDPTTGGLRSALRHDLESIKGKWMWLLILGISLIVMGVIVLVCPYAGTAAAVWVVGIMLVLGGIAQAVGAFWTREWSGFFLSLLLGVLYFVAGVFTLRHPVFAAASLTLLIGSFMLIGGVFKITAALVHRFPNWIWVLLSGVLSALLGFFIWSEIQEFTPFLLGTLLGIDMIFNGWMWVALSLMMKKIGTRVTERIEARAAGA